jgi:hypothetical protein
MKIENLNEIIASEFKSKSETTDRYTSFDYCYNYFKRNNDFTNDIEKSCLVLGFYLASWGMLRGSSFLLQKSVKHFQNLIEYYSTLDKKIWEIDLDTYDDTTILKILEIYQKTKEAIITKENTHLTLITKILLGVFGFIPAYDQYFCNTFRKIFEKKCGFSVVNSNSLNCLKEFYDNNKLTIDNVAENTFTTDFLSGQKTNITYPKAKIVDMYGFTNSLRYALPTEIR